MTPRCKEDIEKMRKAGAVLADILNQMCAYAKAGMTTADLNDFGEQLIMASGGRPNFKNYEGFPAAFCISLNEEVVHGIPSPDRVIRNGDVLKIDGGVLLDGWHSDAARTVLIGEVSEEARRLARVTEESFFAGIAFARAGHYLHEISAAIGAYAGRCGYGVIRELCGHGIGRDLHEEPDIPNYKKVGSGMKLAPGMTFAIEPMLAIGTCRVDWMDDWTVVSADRSLTAHYENTILITDGEPEILTLRSII